MSKVSAASDTQRVICEAPSVHHSYDFLGLTQSHDLRRRQSPLAHQLFFKVVVRSSEKTLVSRSCFCPLVQREMISVAHCAQPQTAGDGCASCKVALSCITVGHHIPAVKGERVSQSNLVLLIGVRDRVHVQADDVCAVQSCGVQNVGGVADETIASTRTEAAGQKPESFFATAWLWHADVVKLGT